MLRNYRKKKEKRKKKEEKKEGGKQTNKRDREIERVNERKIERKPEIESESEMDIERMLIPGPTKRTGRSDHTCAGGLLGPRALDAHQTDGGPMPGSQVKNGSMHSNQTRESIEMFFSCHSTLCGLRVSLALQWDRRWRSPWT
jgi:hypothetical protein